MKKLNLKLARDLKASKGLFAAVTIVIFLAVTFFGLMFMAYENLNSSYDYSYEKLNFADFTVKLSTQLPDVEKELESIEGVNAVTGRMNADYSLTLPGEQQKNILVRTLSLPSSRNSTVNDVHIEKGSYFAPSNGYSLLLEKNFAEHHGLEPGDTVSLSVEGKATPFEVAGIATSPEYIFFAKSRQELLVSPEVWGVVFVPENIRSSLLNQPINEYCFLLEEGIELEAVLPEVKQTLDNRILDIVLREDVPSYAGLEMDLEGFEAMAEMFPALFIIVGVLAIYILLTRIVYNQRTQIGLMRAVGYSRKQVMTHYLGFSLLIGIAGSAAGIITGYFLSEALTNFYATMINLPFTTTRSHWAAVGEGVVLGVLPCVIAGLIPAWRASRILPAEAMRTPAPAAGRRLLLERIFPFLSRLSSLWKIPLRNVFRNGRRSLYTIIGVIFGISLILVSAGMIDSMNDMFDLQFNKIQRYDVKIRFAEPQPGSLIDDFSGWEGVEKAEPVLEVPARLVHEGASYTTLLMALPADSELRGLYSPSRERISVSNEGIMLTESLSDTLGVTEGDTLSVMVQSPSGSLEFPLKIQGFAEDPIGNFGYIDIELARSQAGGDILTGMLLAVDPAYEDQVRERAFEAGAASVEITSESHEELESMMEAGTAMLWLMLLFGAILAMAIVFTTVMVNIMERRREIATMRTIGESRTRIGAMITIENLILGITGLVPGIILGYILAFYFFEMFQGDMFSMDLVIFPTTYALTAGIVILIVLLSQVPGIRNANRLDLARVTKEQAS
ncbi:MAG: FtsX-like permease family protein [Dehalococcoidia bacterium]